MGNSQTSDNQAVITFVWGIGGTYVLGFLVALRLWQLVHGHWFRCDEEPLRPPAQKATWYSSLNKPRGWPGSLAYLLFYFLVYFFQFFTMWYVWINVPAREDAYGVAFLWLGTFYLVFNALASEFLFGHRGWGLTVGMLLYILAAVISIVALAMVAVLTWPVNTKQKSLLPNVAAFVLQCIATTGAIMVMVTVIVLKAYNPDEEISGAAYRSLSYEEQQRSSSRINAMHTQHPHEHYEDNRRESGNGFSA